jgi:predicted metal-binding membrane protein
MAHSSDLPLAKPLSAMRFRPRGVALLSIAALAGLGWIYLALMTAAAPNGFMGRAVIDALCRTGPASGGVSTTLLVFAMWAAMAAAMMLPTASGTVLAYADIAEAAAAQREPVVSPLVLIAGYLVVWLGFALVTALLQQTLVRFAMLDQALVPASPLLSGVIMMAAGAYQFSRLKHACLTRCRRPFTFLFANWSTRPAIVFRLGVQHGVYCVGCCWAMMLLMFAVGVMNVVWMAALGVIMAIEKLCTTPRLTPAIGTVLMAVGAGICAVFVAPLWPT